MKVSNSIFDVVILLGAIQGFIISGLLYFKRERLYANKLLAAITFLIALACLNMYLLDVGATNNSTFWSIISLIVPLVIVMPIGPLIFFYVRSLAQSDFKLSRSNRIHFYSVIVDFLPHFVGIVFVIGALAQWIKKSEFSAWGNFIDTYNVYADIPRWISVCIYTALAWKEQKKIKTGESDSWPKYFVISFVIFEAIWLLHLVPYVIPSVSDQFLNWVGWYPVYIPLAAMVYWLGFNGYLRGRPSLTKSPLDMKTVSQAIEKLRDVMLRDQVFLDPELTLQSIVTRTGLQQKTISAVLNQHLGKSFNEFVNEYRVNEVKKKLLDNSFKHMTIVGIAFECGFNSQATFQRAFKQFTNQSPSEFQLRCLGISQNTAQN